jgi:hypothetical protein
MSLPAVQPWQPQPSQGATAQRIAPQDPPHGAIRQSLLRPSNAVRLFQQLHERRFIEYFDVVRTGLVIF